MVAANCSKAPAPSEEQLRLAYRHMARPGWPPTLEAAMQIHHYRICITQLARRLGRPAWAGNGRSAGLVARLHGPPVPPTPSAPPSAGSPGARANHVHTQGSSLGSWFRAKPADWIGTPDRKRLAANDID
jgi:hypothetical protein